MDVRYTKDSFHELHLFFVKFRSRLLFLFPIFRISCFIFSKCASRLTICRGGRNRFVLSVGTYPLSRRVFELPRCLKSNTNVIGDPI